MKWKRLGYLLGIVIPTIAGLVPAAPARAQSIELPIDFTVNFKNYLNVKNGIAGLDANAAYAGKTVGDVSAAQTSTTSNTLYTTTAISICAYNPTWAPTPGGTGFAVGDLVTSGGDGSVVKVTSVDASGAVTGVSIVTPGVNYYNPTGLSTNSSIIAGGSNTTATQVCLTPTAVSASTLTSGAKSISAVTQSTVNDFFANPTVADLTKLAISKNANYVKVGDGKFPDTSTSNLDYPAFFKGKATLWFVDLLGTNIDNTPIYTANGTIGFQFPYAGYNYPTLGIYSTGLPTMTVGRVDNGHVNNTAPTWAFDLVNDDAINGKGWTSNISKFNAQVNTWVTSNASGPTAGLAVRMQDDSNGGYVQQNYPFTVSLIKTGLSWDWGISDTITEAGGVDYSSPDRSAGGNSPVEFEGEHNLNGVGYDTKNSAWGAQAFRVNQLASTGIYPSYVPFWKASTAFSAKHMVRVLDTTTGRQYLYTTDADGVTGTTEPSFTFNETTTVTDGTIKWVFLGELTYQVGVGYQSAGSCSQPIDYPDGYTGTHVSYCAQIGTSFAATANIYGTAFDASTATFIQKGAHAWARTQADSYLDLTANGTQLGLDKHIFGYDSSNGLTYKIKSDMTKVGADETWFNAWNTKDSGMTYFYDEANPVFTTDTASSRSIGESTLVYSNAVWNASRFNPHGEFVSTVENTSFLYFGNDYTNPGIMSWIVPNTGQANTGYEWWNFSPFSNSGPQKLMVLNPLGFYLTNNVPEFFVYNKSSLDNGAITTDGSGNMTVVSVAQSPVALASITTPKTGQSVFDSATNTMWFYTGTEWHHSDPIRTAYASLPTAGKYVNEAYYCTDCYSKLREDGDTQTGIVLYWNGTSFRDALGIDFNHP